MARVVEGPYSWLIGGADGDSVRLTEAPPDSLLDVLDRLEVPMAEATIAPAVRADAVLVPFGWDAATLELAQRYRRVPEHPSLDVVRRVNGRVFADRVSRERLDDDPGPGFARSVIAVCRLLAADRDATDGWMVKAEHGNAGLGNRRITDPELTAGDRQWLEKVFAEHDAVVVERWRSRILDLCTVMVAAPDGSALAVAVHEVVNTAAGSFVGSIFDPAGPAAAGWAIQAAAVASPVAAALAEVGYSGPACLDSFVWWDGAQPRLRPLADLNARLFASWPARELWRRWVPDRIMYWRWFGRRKLALPDDHRAAHVALGDDAFDPRRREGVLLVSPLALGLGRKQRPTHRVAVACIARDRDEVFRLESRFRERLER